ncbi:MAG: Peptide deformylase [Parcubacteria group bacterium GW2011_GWC1_38_6]|nr:MAG: Peptide deformylase [Parcubacteria group bacterium GW2011_GWA1_36_12]KKQ77100.1 MAG: Peptide deformylase [Parcubacteria group bacterium GW2011_GWC1_38_6]
MILEIKKYPDRILKKRAKGIKKIDAEIKKLGIDMIETMKANSGVGLAANQVGILKRIIIVHMENGPEIFINPKITKMSAGKTTDTEGCLSIPEMFLDIKRASGIQVSALNSEGQKINIKVKGLVARIFQHEIDHLNGALIIDRISFWRRLKIKKQTKPKQNGTY